MSKMRVICVGNGYRCDDGVGLAVAQYLRDKLPSEIEVCFQDGEGLALMERWRAFETVFVVDAMRSGAEPGAIQRFDAHEQPLPKAWGLYSTHNFGVIEAIEFTRVCGQMPQCLVVYGIEAGAVGMGKTLSAPVEQAATVVAEQIVVECTQHLARESTCTNSR